MTTFERYFIEDKETHVETKNAYYRLYDNEEIVDKILREFGLDATKSHIVNGHVPVERKKGESPIKCNGKLLVIDGGFPRRISIRQELPGIHWLPILTECVLFRMSRLNRQKQRSARNPIFF